MTAEFQTIEDAYDAKNEKEFYDSLYHRKGDRAMRPLWVYMRWFRYFGQVHRGQKMLDVGCGTGLFLKVACDHGLASYGIELSDSALQLAAKNAPAANLVQGYGEKLPYPDSFFDYVNCLGVLEHYQDLEQGLREIVRVAKPHAAVLLIVPNDKYLFWKLKKISKGTAQRAFEVTKDLRGWKQFITHEPLEIKRIYQDKYPSQELRILYYKNPYKIFRRCLYKMVWLCMPLKYTYQFIFVLQKIAS